MRAFWLVLAASSGVACTTILPGTMPHDPRRDALELEHERCDKVAVDPRIYGADVIQKVSPYTRHVMGGPSGMEAHLAGAELELRPLPGITMELLERGLQCREAELLLERTPAAPNEPYLLPGGWLKIDVRSGGGSFLVTLAAEDPERASEVVTRARAFVGARP